MKILSISTSSNIASVAITEDEETILELNINNSKTHSETLIPLVQELFEKTNLDISQINLIACDVGPGSFTGIRIGIASVKAIAESLNIPVASVTSLETLAYNVSNSNYDTICTLIDARNNQVYAGIFDKNYNLLEDYIADDIKIVIDKLKKYKNIVYVGDGALVHKNLLNIKCFEQENVIHAKNIAKCGYNKFKSEAIKNADTITPLYLRKSQAERMKKQNG